MRNRNRHVNAGIILTPNQFAIMRAMRDGAKVSQGAGSDVITIGDAEFSYNRDIYPIEHYTNNSGGNSLIWRRVTSDGAYVFGLTPTGAERANNL